MVLVYYTWHKTRTLHKNLGKNRQTEPNIKTAVDPKYQTADYFGDGEHDAHAIQRYEKFANDGDS